MKQLLILLLFISTAAQAQKTVYLTKARAKDGPYTAKAFSQFEVGAGVKRGTYFVSNNAQEYVAKSKYTSQDASVSTYFENGFQLFRISGKKALYVYYSKEQGLLTSGIVHDLTAYYDNYWTYVLNGAMQELYRTKAVLPDGKAFQVEAKGFEVSAAQGGKPIFSYRQFLWVKEGSVGFKSLRNDRQPGIWGYTVKHLARSNLSSDVDKKIIDLRDLPFKEGFTTGTISGGSTKLTVKNPSLYNVGDRLIIETGGESDFYGRKGGALGTPGVGPLSWPGKGYASFDELVKADPKFTYAWVHATGKVYQRYADGWFEKGGHINAYIAMAIPAAHRVTVLAKSGSVLTVDIPANVTATDANIYHANDAIFYELTSSLENTDGYTVRVPAGRFAFSEFITIRRAKNFTLQGAGLGKTIFYSPKGSTTVQMDVIFCENYTQDGITMQGNVGNDGWGFRWWPEQRGGNTVHTPDQNGTADYGGALNLGNCTNFNVRVEVRDTYTGAVVMSNCLGGRLVPRVIHSTGVKTYRAWAVVTTDGTEGVTVDSLYFSSPKIYGAFESYGGRNNRFTNLYCINGRGSSNTSENMVIDGFTLIYTKNSRPDWLDMGDPCINYNQNTGRTGQASGGSVLNGQIIFDDYIDEQGNLKVGVNVQEGNENTTIRNVRYSANVPFKKGATVGARGIISTGINTTVENCTVTGGNAPHAPIYSSNIAVLDGQIINCRANSFATGKEVRMEGNREVVK